MSLFYSYIAGSLHVSGPQAHLQESSYCCSHNHWFSICPLWTRALYVFSLFYSVCINTNRLAPARNKSIYYVYEPVWIFTQATSSVISSWFIICSSWSPNSAFICSIDTKHIFNRLRTILTVSLLYRESWVQSRCLKRRLSNQAPSTAPCACARKSVTPWRCSSKRDVWN